jgi:DNA replication protein DnaC
MTRMSCSSACSDCNRLTKHEEATAQGIVSTYWIVCDRPVRRLYHGRRPVSEMMEARDERRLLRFQRQIAVYKLLIIDELGFAPLSKTGAELLFELISQRYERGATLITSNLPFDEWTEPLGSERLTGALLDRITHHVNILEMNGDSYRLAQSR